MEKIETKAEEIKKEEVTGGAEMKKGEMMAGILPKKVSPKKEKIKRKRTAKKIAKPVEMKAETIQKESLAEEAKIEKPEVEKLKATEPILVEPKIMENKTTGLKMEESVNSSKKGANWLKIVIGALILGCMLGLSGAAFYFYRQYKKAVLIQNSAPSAEEQAKKEVQSIKETIGQFMELPGDEEPVLATVTDVEKIKTQPFFANAQNGDKVLIYTNNKRAILYRPSTGKIIEVSAVSETSDNISPVSSVGQTQTSETNPAVPVENSSANSENIARVAIYNGGKISGLAQRIGDRIALIAGITVSEKTNAVGNYEKNLVIDLSGNRQELAQKIAEALGGEVGTLPEGETKPEADILVIAAKE